MLPCDIIIVVNKWDTVEDKDTAMKTFTENFLKVCIILIISALVLYIIYGIISALCAKSKSSETEAKINNSAENANNGN